MLTGALHVGCRRILCSFGTLCAKDLRFTAMSLRTTRCESISIRRHAVSVCGAARGWAWGVTQSADHGCSVLYGTIATPAYSQETYCSVQIGHEQPGTAGLLLLNTRHKNTVFLFCTECLQFRHINTLHASYRCRIRLRTGGRQHSRGKLLHSSWS